MDKTRLARVIVRLANSQHWIINPKLGYLHFVKNFMDLHCCACAPARKSCPCPEARSEVMETGKCKCGLFYRDLDAFLATEPTLNVKENTVGNKD